jgi:hypothetical protein
MSNIAHNQVLYSIDNSILSEQKYLSFVLQVSIPLLFSIIFFVFTCYLDDFMQVLTQHRASELVKDLPPLPDLAHLLFPHLQFYQINNIFLGLSVLLTFLRFFRNQFLRLSILRRLLYLESLILLFRSITIFITTLPPP